jgi:hypothetical protein
MLSRQLVGSVLVSAIGNPDEDILFFDLERIESLLAAFEAICRSLQVSSKDDPLAEIIATKVAEAFATGERNPNRLRDLVLLALRNA